MGLKLQWPIRRAEKDTWTSQNLETQLLSKGFSAVQGTDMTKFRIRGSDEGISEIVDMLKNEHDLFIKSKQEWTPQDLETLNAMKKQLMIWIYYKHFKRASVPFAAANEDSFMAKKLQRMEIYYYRNLEKPLMWHRIMRCLQFVNDITYKEWHIEPPPTLMFQTPVMVTPDTVKPRNMPQKSLGEKQSEQ